jgi:periplasmic mercuric ion binding protein
MKTKFNFILIIFLVTSFYAAAQSKTVKTSIKVFGNCGMCKERIETALDQSGIKVAQWDSKTKNLELVYNRKKISEEKIHELIAGVGHDTEKVKAKDDVYAALPFCCLYRDHDHSGIKDEKPHHHE